MQFLSESELQSVGFAFLGSNVQIHRSTNIVFPERISLASNIRIDGFTTIIASGPVTIGNYVHISAYCHMAARGGIAFADFTGLSSGVKVYSSSDDYSGEALTNPTVPEEFTKVKVAPVVLERHVIVGSTSVILPGVTIGEGCAVGALSLVAKDLPAWGVYSGVPAKRIKARKKDLLEMERRMMAALREAA